MDEVRTQNYELAWIDYQSGMKYKEIAKKYGVTINTVKSWKTRYWSCDKEKSVHTKPKKVCIQKGGQPGNQNAKGHGGTGPLKNKNAEKHGLFAKYLPAETMDIINHMSLSPLDILWDQIQVAYAAIIRAQSIMHVAGKDEMIKELKKEKLYSVKKSESQEKEWNFQFAWDRQAKFMSAQARAQSELRGLIKQYDNMLHKNWDMATDEQRSRIDLVKIQTEKIQKDLSREQEQPIQVTFRRASETIGIGNTEGHEFE